MPATVIGHRGYPIIRDFWEHYTEFADLYDRFALSSVGAVDELERLFGFTDKSVLNIGSGSGRDSFAVAGRARHVLGIEPSAAMREYAVGKKRALGVENVEFVGGIAENLAAFGGATFDRAISVHAAPFPWDTDGAAIREAMRVVRRGGFVAFVSTTPGWRMDHQPPGADEGYALPDFLERALRAAWFTHRDTVVEMDYGSVAEALATWGCIYGEEAIDYLLDRRTAVLTWSLRIWYRQV